MIDLRNTVQRQIILDVLKTMHGHPTAEDVYREVQKMHPSISKATVYRNLHQLCEKRTIMPVMIPGSPERFDERLSRHYHFKCKTCGHIFDVDIDYLSKINEEVARMYGFEVDEHDVVFKGNCPQCRKAQKDVSDK